VRSLKMVAGAMAVVLNALSSPASAADALSFDHRQITVVGGSSFRVGETVYKLAGIQAPAPGQTCDHKGHSWPCGDAAASALRKLIELQASPIHCFVQSGDGPASTACFVGDRELSIVLLEGGHVAARPGASLHYVAAERSAKRASLGIWPGASAWPSGHGGGQGPGETGLPTIVTFKARDIEVIDGDSFQVGSKTYQLAGIDAPELGQACDDGGHLSLCGLTAAYELRKLFELETGPIECAIESDADRPEAVCLIGDSEISVLLLKDGSVVALPDSAPYYRASEHRARHARLGIWSGTLVPPWDWRNGERLPSEHNFDRFSHLAGQLPWKWNQKTLQYRPRAEHAACLVKGIVTETGERLYFGPLDKAFESIEIDPEKGERLFCGDDEARRAGWRRKGER